LEKGKMYLALLAKIPMISMGYSQMDGEKYLALVSLALVSLSIFILRLS